MSSSIWLNFLVTIDLCCFCFMLPVFAALNCPIREPLSVSGIFICEVDVGSIFFLHAATGVVGGRQHAVDDYFI